MFLKKIVYFFVLTLLLVALVVVQDVAQQFSSSKNMGVLPLRIQRKLAVFKTAELSSVKTEGLNTTRYPTIESCTEEGYKSNEADEKGTFVVFL